ncbi:Gfo/Idh/MocA family oxidoreductase [Patescibacteria group bacterium]|nr:Gfo/Idh/MocA family oxidoreductase [Patescibacteria group bacterium]
MKFLICGLGSIGKRHLENLEKIGFKCRDIAIFRTHKGTKSFGDKVLEKHKNRHSVFDNLERALEQKPEAVIISNPTSLHLSIALAAAKAGCNLFIEKPVSDNLEGVDELIRIVKRKKLVTFVAHQLRFHPLLKQIKEWLEEKKIGKVVCVHAEMAERVTDWHPWENYKISYATRKDLGGGVILTQSHELDYLYWLFGKPQWIFASGGELGDLKIGVEDTVKSIMEFKGGIIASLHLDYLKRPPCRFLEITGAKGRIYWNYFEKKIQLILINGATLTVKEPRGFGRNVMYFNEIGHFIDCIKGNVKPLIDLMQGKAVLEMALAIKESVRKKKRIVL